MSTSKKAASDERASGYHHGNLRQALLDNGLAMLESCAHGQISLRELARRVGVSANAAYRHFSNKDDLLTALAAEGKRRFSANQMSVWAATEGDAQERFLATGCAYVRFARDNPALFRLIFGRFVIEHPTEEMQVASNEGFHGLHQGVAAVLDLDIDDPQVELAAYNAWAVVHGYSHLILDGMIQGDANAIDDKVEQALRLWMQPFSDR